MEKVKSLAERLRENAQTGGTPFHMPGHKRNADLAPYLEQLGARWDVTEIPGFDDLHDAQGVLAQGMERCRALYGAKRSFFLVNGSTGGLLAGIRAATGFGDRVLVARNCHKAVYHALEICGLRPVFLQPETLEGFGFAGDIKAGQVARALEDYPDTKLVILTSPTYEGVLSDVARIGALAHEKGALLLVDGAHGAHLGLHDVFPCDAVQAADLVIQSFHKTLPSLTQSAVLHVGGERVDAEQVARNLGMFQSSSPSYLLMASLEGCVGLLEERGEELLLAWKERQRAFRARVEPLRRLRLVRPEDLDGRVFGMEPSKLVILTREAGLSGKALMQQLRENYGIQLEMALEDYAVAMTGMGDTPEMLEKLAAALLELDGNCLGEALPQSPVLQGLPQQLCTPSEAMGRAWETVSSADAAGRVSAGYLWAYPPGVPLLVPGEAISAALVEKLRGMREAGIKLVTSRGEAGRRWAVVTE